MTKAQMQSEIARLQHRLNEVESNNNNNSQRPKAKAAEVASAKEEKKSLLRRAYETAQRGFRACWNKLVAAGRWFVGGVKFVGGKLRDGAKFVGGKIRDGAKFVGRKCKEAAVTAWQYAKPKLAVAYERTMHVLRLTAKTVIAVSTLALVLAVKLVQWTSNLIKSVVNDLTEVFYGVMAYLGKIIGAVIAAVYTMYLDARETVIERRDEHRRAAVAA